jgi:hypothetical protein
MHFRVPWGIPLISACQGTYFGQALISGMACTSSFNQHKVSKNLQCIFSIAGEGIPLLISKIL